MSLSSRFIIALLRLSGCGRITTFKIANYADSLNLEINNSNDLFFLLQKCKEQKIANRIKEYSFIEIEDAINDADIIISKSGVNGIGIVSYYDSDFPVRLKNLSDEKGSILSPIVLYYLGDIKKANYPAIAIIGTREPTPEGVIAGEYFGNYFSSKGYNIISGLAIGCDTAGHKGALSANGITTAFLAHGLDTIYPPENKLLAKSIIDSGGLLLSEYPIGDFLTANKLIDRDRLQAGLAQATIVIQTGIKGGTMHAANATLNSKKPLYVVEYKSPNIMNHEKVKGNTYLTTKGAKYINTQNASEIALNLSQKNESIKPNLSLFDNM